MFRNRLYYTLKPLLPWVVRMGIRRWFARRKRRRVSGVWPIRPGSEKPPEGWPGWPEGKQFAFVLTHDVEGVEGLKKVRRLAELEMRLGFRSSFNFIPEGHYQVPKDLIAWLVSNGFEVGVHDLKHDGRLFRSRKEFSSHAQRINSYLKEWGAVGFRSGFMLRNLDWLHGLEVQYDASTFDTDPFEPQPQGQNTIFPFWVASPKAESEKQKAKMGQQPAPVLQPLNRQRRVGGPGLQGAGPVPSPGGSWVGEGDGPQPAFDVGCSKVDVRCSQPSLPGGASVPASRPSDSDVPHSALRTPHSALECSAPSSQLSAPSFTRSGYVELPYTLPQDSTLFLLLREKSPEIWLNKLDWIARHGGMALVNVHPDYLQFEEEKPSARTFPVQHYIDFLTHARAQHAQAFWQPLPREVAAFAAPLRQVQRPSRRICMATHSFYETDNRVIRYAEALAARGDSVDVLSLRRSPETPREEMINGVRVLRLQSRYGKVERGPLGFLLPILRFGAICAGWITRQHLSGRRHDLFHIHNIPDFLVFTATVPRLAGVPVILDVHDIVPEFFASKFGPRHAGIIQPMLRLMERVSAAFASHVIIANDLWVEKYAARTGAGGKCSAFINNVDSVNFAPSPRTRTDGRLILLFPGGLQWHQGLDIAIRAMPRIRQHLSNAELHIYGDGNMKPRLVELAHELGLNGSVQFHQPLRSREIAAVMADADLGIVPKRADGFGNEAYSTKIMEFMSVGVPVVISSTKVDRFYFDDSVVRFFESGNETALAGAVVEVLSHPEQRQAMVSRASAYAVRHSWESRKGDYLKIVDDLCAGR